MISHKIQEKAYPPPFIAKDVGIPTPEHVRQKQAEVEFTYSKIMDEMEDGARESGYPFAKFGSKGSGNGYNQDNRALVYTEPIMQEATMGKGPFRKTVQKPAFVVMTRVGPKIMTPANELQAKLLQDIVSNRISAYVQQRTTLSAIPPAEKPTNREENDVNEGKATLDVVNKVRSYRQGFYDVIPQSYIVVGGGAEPQVAFGENIGVIGNGILEPVDNATFTEAVERNKEIAKSRHVPQLAKQQERLSDARALRNSLSQPPQGQGQ